MDQGLKAPLSSNEEITLRRVDYGIAKPSDFHAGDIEYLTRLTLIERNGDKLIVTSLGKQRLAVMRGSAVPLATDQQMAQLFDKIMKQSPD